MALNRIERDRRLQGRGRIGADGVDEHLVSLVSPTSFPAEQYRALLHTVEQMHRDGALQIAAVTSPAPGDGKTTTAINLAGALAQAPEARVLLVDADLRRASVDLRQLSVGRRLGMDDCGGPGLAEALLDPTVSLEDVVRLYPAFNLAVLPAGRSPDRPYEVLKSSRLEELLKEACRKYDYVVVDTPPLVIVPDCRIIAKWLDGVFLVVAAHKTPRKLVEEALNLLDAEKLIGIVFNNDDRPLSSYYGDYYYGSSGDERIGWWARVTEKFRFRPAFLRAAPGKMAPRRTVE